MKLHDSIGVWFSRLDCTRAERWFCYDFSMHGDHRKEGNYRYYGDLSDGTRCGAFVFPSMTSWADFKDPPFTGIVLVDGKGKMKTLTPAERMHQLPEEHYFPIADREIAGMDYGGRSVDVVHGFPGGTFHRG